MIILGSKVKDTITGFTGIATARTVWLNGCIRITIQSQELKEGKPLDSYTIDEPQCEVLMEAEEAYKPSNHGDRENISYGH